MEIPRNSCYVVPLRSRRTREETEEGGVLSGEVDGVVGLKIPFDYLFRHE